MDYYGFPTGVPRYSTPQPVYQWNNYYPEANNIIYSYTDDYNQYNQYNQYDPYNQGQQTLENYHKNYYNFNQHAKWKKRNKVNHINYGNYEEGNNYNFNYPKNYNVENYENYFNNWENLGSDNSSNYKKYETNIAFGKDGKMKVYNNIQKKSSQTNINKNTWKGNTSNQNQKQNPYNKYTTENYYNTNTQQYLDNNLNINNPNSNNDIDIDTLLNNNTNNNNIEFATAKKESNNTNINYGDIFSNPTDNKGQIFPISDGPGGAANQNNYNIENIDYSSSNQNDIVNQIDKIIGNADYSSNQIDNTNNQNDGYSSNQIDNTNNQNGGLPSTTNNNNIDNNTENGGFSSKPDETINNNNIIENKDNNITTTDNNNPGTQKPMPPIPIYVLPNTYYFHKTGLYNIGSTCYMNATLQCLLHVSPLVAYFIEIYFSGSIDPIFEGNGNTEGLNSVEGIRFEAYYDDKYAIKYSKCNNYFEYASKAIEEMYRQVGSPVFDNNDIMKKGLIVRHLMLPGLKEDSKKILEYLYNTYKDNIYISIMNQYTPIKEFKRYKELNNKIDEDDYDEVIDYACDLGIKKAFIQEGETQSESFIPTFSNQTLPL